MAFELVAFEDWLEDITAEFDVVSAIMSERIPDDDNNLVQHLSKIDAWKWRISKLAADADSYLDISEKRELLNRSDDWTDLDRRTRMREACAKERRLRNYMEYMRESIQSRLILGMALLKRNATDRMASSRPT